MIYPEDWYQDLTGQPLAGRLLMGHEYRCRTCGRFGGFHDDGCLHAHQRSTTATVTTLHQADCAECGWHTRQSESKAWADRMAERHQCPPSDLTVELESPMAVLGELVEPFPSKEDMDGRTGLES